MDEVTATIRDWEQRIQAIAEPYRSNIIQTVTALVVQAESVFQANAQPTDQPAILFTAFDGRPATSNVQPVTSSENVSIPE
jgi:hypothetical protein